MDKVKNFFENIGFKTILTLIILAISIPITIFIVKQQQIIKSKATSELVQFTGNNIKTINSSGEIRQIATLEDIEIELTIPTNATPAPSSSTTPRPSSSTSPSPTPSVSATPRPSATATPNPTASPTPTPRPTPTASPTTSNTCPDECYSDELWVGISKVGNVCDSTHPNNVYRCPGSSTATCNGQTWTCNGSYWYRPSSNLPWWVNLKNKILSFIRNFELVKTALAYCACTGNCSATDGSTTWSCVDDSNNYYSGTGTEPPAAPAAPAATVAPASNNGFNPTGCSCTVNCGGAASEQQCWSCYSDSQGYYSYCDERPASAAAPAVAQTAIPAAIATATPIPASSATPGTTSSPSPSAQPSTIPTNVTFTHYKISEADTDAGWSSAPQYPVSQRKVSYKFVPYVCVTQPCDPYPRALRRVHVQLIGKNFDNSEYKQVFSKDIILALKPVTTSVSCEASATGTGTSVIVKGLHFGTDIGGISVGSQNATIAQSDSWTNLQATANISTSIYAQSEITLTTPDGQKTTSISCTPGQTALNFTASAACNNITKPLTQASVEIKEKSIGIGLTAQITSTTSVFKNDRVSFTSEGKPIDLNVRLIEGQEYNLIIQAANLLRRVISFKAGKGTTNIENVDLPMGDIAPSTGDCSINTLDRSELIRQWGRSVSGSATADFDQNGPVNTADLACLISNFNKRCENP